MNHLILIYNIKKLWDIQKQLKSLMKKLEKFTVKHIFKKHGEFLQTPNHHLQGSGCKKCFLEKYTKSTDKFIEEAKEIHGDNYDYSDVEYINNCTRVKIYCKKHKKYFYQLPTDHINNGSGCPLCAIEKQIQKQSSTTKEFIDKAKKIHGDNYDCSKVEYINNHTPIILICKKHGEFLIKPINHLKGYGCPKCKMSKGENKIDIYFKNKNINYIYQKRFKDCKDKKLLSFDFYLSELNLIIEFNGKQHYSPLKKFGNEERFYSQIKRDKIKIEYCKSNKINLLIIPHTQYYYIEKILDNILSLIDNKTHMILENYIYSDKKREKIIYYNYDEAKEIVNKNNIKTRAEYRKFYKKDKRLVSTPERRYKNWISWQEFLSI